MPSTLSPELEIVIEPSHGLRFLNWRELWAYRDLLRQLVWRDFATRYKQTVLGPLWHLVQPLITTLIFTIVFSHVAELSTDGLPPTLFYLCGLLAWNYFAQSFSSTSGTLVANAGLFGKVYFPRLIVPLSSIVSNLISFAIQFVTFVVLFALYRMSHVESSVGPGWSALLLPIVLLQLAALSLGIGLWLAALTAKFRDFSVLSGFLIQLWLYVTPIIYPLAKVPEQWRAWVAFNPVAVPVESFRLMLLGTGSVTPTLILISVGTTLAALVSGILVFQRVEKNFIDVV
ncbi:ABC transporter permease [Horticoccus luteus]|uniref:Transport permease protein n=1 Tax=Horticoccus luteus TaxID=2862869 RepID=A0A8F9TYT6_9BACT|nr:ABC transporter permease [Horticoccus luteus]QYM80502.1 ABC transporter permease [Horticoccus luteus]